MKTVILVQSLVILFLVVAGFLGISIHVWQMYFIGVIGIYGLVEYYMGEDE